MKVLSDLLLAVDRGDIGVLVLLDLSAAFDTVDHAILLERLRRSFGVTGKALDWLESYLTNRKQFVRLGTGQSDTVELVSGVPQGSVLGPSLFILYTADLVALIQSHHLHPHLYADDTQLYGSCRPGEISELVDRANGCLRAVGEWMRRNRLQLNAGKTEVMWLATGRRLEHFTPPSLDVDGVAVLPSSSVRNLGIHVDADFIMREHVSRTVCRCFSALRQLRPLRPLVESPTFRTLVQALVLSRLDYGNCALYGQPAYLFAKLQLVQNAAARLVFGLRRSDHITDALLSLHWLRVRERVDFKLAVLMFRVLHHTAPSYLGPFNLYALAGRRGRSSSASSASSRLVVPPTQLKTVGSRAFAVAGPAVWNSLPASVVSQDTLPSFRRHLKTHLFSVSYPGVVV